MSDEWKPKKSLVYFNEAMSEAREARRSEETDTILSALAVIDSCIDLHSKRTADLDEINEKLDRLDVQLDKLMRHLGMKNLG